MPKQNPQERIEPSVWRGRTGLNANVVDRPFIVRRALAGAGQRFLVTGPLERPRSPEGHIPGVLDLGKAETYEISDRYRA